MRVDPVSGMVRVFDAVTGAERHMSLIDARDAVANGSCVETGGEDRPAGAVVTDQAPGPHVQSAGSEAVVPEGKPAGQG